MPMDRLWILARSIGAAITLAAFTLVVWIWGIIFFIVGTLNLLYALITGSKLGGIDMLFEPFKWSVHQTKVLVGASDDFRWAPFL